MKNLFNILNNFFNQLWYGKQLTYWLLVPFSFLYQFFVGLRRFFLLRFSSQQFPIPIIIVGNLTVGGVGKTPLVIAIANQLKAKGIRVGIVSRGYKGKQKKFPYRVQPTDLVEQVGDEPLLILNRTNCPVVISPKRTQAVEYLINQHKCQVVISDDGLQHYALGRMIEILVIDGVRKIGNGFCLPAGPLREGKHRLLETDFIVVNGIGNDISASDFLSELMKKNHKSFNSVMNLSGKANLDLAADTVIAVKKEKETTKPAVYKMNFEAGELTSLLSKKKEPLHHLNYPIAAVAGIGHPARFFKTLEQLGIEFTPYAFQDHHLFQAYDLELKEKTIIMTEKDAVKCETFAKESWYFLPVEAKLSGSFWEALYKMLWSHEQLKGCH